MDDEIPPFAPPSGGLTPPVQPPQPQPQQPQPSPYGPPPQLFAAMPTAATPATAPAAPPAPSYLPLPPPPPRRRLSRNSVIGIVAGSAAILLIVVGAIGASALVLQTFGAPSTAHSSGSSAPSTPHPGGVTSSARAQQPLQCTASCFANDNLVPGDTVPPANAITALGLTTTVDSLGDYDSSTASDEYDQTLTGWKDAKASPAQCFFTYFQSPVVASVGERPDRDITEIDYSGTHRDKAKNNTLTQSVRIFANSADAEAHMQQLADSLTRCLQYRTVDSSGTTYYDVAPAAAFTDFPSSEAAVGWTETSAGDRYESIDVQRGNLVVRTTLQSFDEGVTQAQFRSFVDDDAWQIASILTPGDGR